MTSANATISASIPVDLNRSAEDYIKLVEQHYIVPALVREKFPQMVKLLFETESMDQEEREYWLQIMPIMNEDQAKKLMDIMTKEKTQLADIEDKYDNKKPPVKVLDEAVMEQKREEIEELEKKKEEAEKIEEENLLKEIQNS